MQMQSALSQPPTWSVRGREWTFDRVLLMGIVNVTPDSFADGGLHFKQADALAHARRLIDDGADIIDIGGESTRPAATAVPLDEERRRILPLLEKLAARNVPVSVDTQKPELMREAISAGAAMINDINALLAPGALETVAKSTVAVCLMHKQGTPASMQADPQYGDVVAEVCAFLRERVQAAQGAGIGIDRITVDPGFGFGKTLEHNLDLLRSLRHFSSLGSIVLAGLSRKAMLGRITGRDVGQRAYGSVAGALIAVQNGAQIVRVHDVAATRDALAVWQAVRG